MKPAKTSFELLTFYHFVDILEDEVESVVADHLSFCHDIGLKGRIYIGTEGISSTVTGNLGQCRAYRLYLENSKYFKNIADIDIKSTVVNGHQFEKMTVKVRNEIVALGEKVTAEEVQKYKKELTPEEFKRIIDEGDENYLILDMRNDYEYRLGHFKGALPAGTINFREVPDLLEWYKKMAGDKKIIWYCTGGIRCEKAAVLANKSGISDIYAIEGGVVKYVNTYNDGNWLGNLYTFDGRVSTQVGDEKTHTTIGTCLHSGKLTDNCENCRYTDCNARMIVDEKEYRKYLGFCSEECFDSAQNDLLIKDVDWDTPFLKGDVRPGGQGDLLGLNPQSLRRGESTASSIRRTSSSKRSSVNYKELRSLVRNKKIPLDEAREMVEKHFRKLLGKRTFPHKESQKEGVIAMD